MNNATPLLPDDWLLRLPHLETHRPKGKQPRRNLRLMASAILWRAVPAELGGWQTAFNPLDRWKKLGIRKRLLAEVAHDGASLGMVHLDGTNVRAYQKAGGAQKGAATHLIECCG